MRRLFLSHLSHRLALLAACLVAALSSAPVVHAEPAAAGKTIAYDKINPIVQFAQHDKRSPLAVLDARVAYDDSRPLRVWLSGPMGQELVLEDGRLRGLPAMSPDDAKRHTLHFDRPDKDVTLTLSFSLIVERTELAYQDLFLAVNDANALKKRTAGALAWLVPDFEALRFQFDGPATVSFEAGGRERSVGTDAGHALRIDLEPAVLKANPTVRFSRLPRHVMPVQ